MRSTDLDLQPTLVGPTITLRPLRRDDFAAAVDFVGWYLHQTERRLGIPKDDAFHQYLAYHEGHRGYRERSHHNKPWLAEVAAKVETYAQRYREQLATCVDD